MTADTAPHPADAIVCKARRLLAALPDDPATWPPLRWVIHPSTLDAFRDWLEVKNVLVTDVTAGEPRLFGLPYDFGYPAGGIALLVVPAA